ncbi:EI24 domain-containing protein [Pseudogemmobacter sonorensis]|uniref:EI24 domain-containing protein n=1 Tax=Pseudogemmobacter sonorensis TaxID=2989681 RepID=UPI00369B6EA1
MILASFAAALGQLGDWRFLRVVGLGLMLAFALLVAIYAGFLALMSGLAPDEIEIFLIGPVTGLHQVIGWASLAAMLVLSAFLMVPVAAAFAGLFTDDVADAVEARHYAWLPRVAPRGVAAGLKSTINLIGLILGLNLILLVTLPFSGFFGVPLYYLANGYLLGREYFTAAASRRLGPDETVAMRRRHGSKIWGAGVLMALPLTIPLVNLLIPVLGTATFTHLYHRLRADED